jgi:pyrroline-5-carboxylate reductase
MEFPNIGFIGGGRICRIFLTALKNPCFSMRDISVYDCSRQACETIKTHFPEVKIESNLNNVATSNFVILAIHPQVMMETL